MVRLWSDTNYACYRIIDLQRLNVHLSLRVNNDQNMRGRTYGSKYFNVGSKLTWEISATLRPLYLSEDSKVDCVWNVTAHAHKPDFFFPRNGWVHLNRRGRQFSRLLAAGVCASAVVMLDTPCSEVVWRVLASHSIP